MARFIQLIGPILHHSSTGRFYYNPFLGRTFSYLLAVLLMICSLYYCLTSESTLLLGVAILEMATGFLILLELLLRNMKTDPLESRRLEMTAYCLGGVIMLLSCIYQFSEAYINLQRGVAQQILPATLGVVSSIAGNLLLVRLLWRAGLIRDRLRVFCRPLLGMLLLNALSLLTSILLPLLSSLRLDAVLGIISSIVLFLLTAGVMIDAYWHLAEIDRKGLKNSELETLI